MPAKIEDYALIGNGQTACLVDRWGSIDWLCWPCFDSDACFAALLGDHRNGFWKIAPKQAAKTSRSYRQDTLILETHFESEDGAVTVIDCMSATSETNELVRLIRCDRGRVMMRMDLALRFGFGLHTPWVRKTDDQGIQAICGPDMVVLQTSVQTRGEDMTTVAEFEVSAGDEAVFVLTYAPSYKTELVPTNASNAIRDTESFWTAWCERCTYEGSRREIVLRSLMTLKALIYAPSGGIVAAPTTSLPEKIGGVRNWDYRFCWVRDATFTLLALMNSGYSEEATAWHNWLLRAVAGSPGDMQIMYGITGQRRLIEWEADWLSGYEGSTPVRVGNAAHEQLQIDVYGELMDVFHQSRSANLVLDESNWPLECKLLEHLADIWDHPDSGIWERRGPGKHYVSSKFMAWVAFDRGIKSAEQFNLDGPLDQWRALRDTIHQDVCDKGFDVAQNAFVEAYGSDLLDASVLLMPAVGFLPPHDPRVQGTMRAIEAHLVRDGFVLRHDPRSQIGATYDAEGAFLPCTLWLADAYVLAGEIGKAKTLFDRVVAIANDVGLLSEEYDVTGRRLVGNFPQALTHIALINTAHNLDAADKPVVQRSQG